MKLAITRVRRNPAKALSPDIKSGNYLNNILGVAEAIELGADDCLMLNPAGNVTEASNSNVFFVIDDQLVTPSAESGVLRGITETAIQQSGDKHRIAIHEASIPASELSRSTECFVTSATREVMPVVVLRLENGICLDYLPGGGPVTCRAATAHKRYVEQYVAAHSDIRLL